MKPTEKMWRTLVRVLLVDKGSDGGVYLSIPGLSMDEDGVFVNRQGIPLSIFRSMKKGKRYRVGCNIGAENKNQLCFDGWEKD